MSLLHTRHWRYSDSDVLFSLHKFGSCFYPKWLTLIPSSSLANTTHAKVPIYTLSEQIYLKPTPWAKSSELCRTVCVCVYKSAGMHTSTWSEEERFLSSSLSLTQLASTTSNNTSIQNQREWALVLFSSFMTSSIIPIKQVMPKLYFSYDMNASQMHSFSKFTLLKVFKLSCVECLCLRAHYQMKFDCVFVSWQVYFRKISPYVHYVHTICVTQCTQNFNECYMNVRTTFLK